jgi:uncharacterized Zn-binding protein involved in type VI secretion
MKKALVMLLVAALLAGTLGFTPVRAAEGVIVQVTVGSTKATINGKEVVLDQPPIIENDRTLVPFRFLGEAIGAQVAWNPTNKMVSYAYGDVSIVLIIGSTTAVVNGKQVTLDVAPKILPTGRTVLLRIWGRRSSGTLRQGWSRSRWPQHLLYSSDQKPCTWLERRGAHRRTGIRSQAM